jgi:DNA polymerase III subunit epsilon
MMPLLLCIAVLFCIWTVQTQMAKKPRQIPFQEPLLSEYIIPDTPFEPKKGIEYKTRHITSGDHDYDAQKVGKNVSEKALLEVSFVAIDFETANRRRGSACAVGMCKVEGGRVVDRYHQYIRPVPMVFEQMNINVHGITESHTANAPTIAEEWANIQAFVGDLPLVAHNASFDKSVLDNSLESNGLNASGWSIACTMEQAKRVFDGKIVKLKDLCHNFDIHLNHHNAGSDAEACALVRIELLKLDTKPYKSLVKTKLVVIKEDTPSVSEALKGLTIVFTGDFDTMTREDIEDLARSHGAKVTSSVSKKTSYVVQGDIFASGKLDKAELLGVEVIGFKAFMKMIDQNRKSVNA